MSSSAESAVERLVPLESAPVGASTDPLDLGGRRFTVEQPFLVRHALAGHPLMELSSLAELAERLLRTGNVRYYQATKVGADDPLEGVADRNRSSVSVRDAVLQVEHNESYIFIQNVQTDAVYRPLIDRCLDQVAEQTEADDPRMNGRCGWIFISAPNAITPYHRDHEKTLLLQCRGSKRLKVWDPRDREVVSAAEDEIFHAFQTLRETRYVPALDRRARDFEIRPGEGIYMPYTAPHLVTNGPEVSVSFSVTYNTRSSRRVEAVYTANHKLRQLGVSPREYGVSAARDRLKEAALDIYRKARGVLRRDRGPEGNEPMARY